MVIWQQVGLSSVADQVPGREGRSKLTIAPFPPLVQILLPIVILFSLTFLLSPASLTLPSCIHSRPSTAGAIPACLTTLSPLPLSSYLSRQRLLASTLIENNISAYISEPSPTSLYFFNVTSTQWHLSERPFLFVVVPFTHPNGAVSAQLSVIVPSFEKTRAQEQLSIAGENIKWLPWEESEDAYAQVGDVSGRIVVDEAMRVGVMAELQRAIGRGEIGVATKEVRSIRERKTNEELALLKCANEVRARRREGGSTRSGLISSCFPSAHSPRYPSHPRPGQDRSN